jgi:hypothetical protein
MNVVIQFIFRLLATSCVSGAGTSVPRHPGWETKSVFYLPDAASVDDRRYDGLAVGHANEKIAGGISSAGSH